MITKESRVFWMNQAKDCIDWHVALGWFKTLLGLAWIY